MRSPLLQAESTGETRPLASSRRAPSPAVGRSVRLRAGLLVLLAGAVSAPAQAQKDPPLAWTAATPDAMVDLALTRARRGGPDALAGLVVAAALDERATLGKVKAGLEAVAASDSPLADEARWLALRHTPEPPGAPWPGFGAVSFDTAPDPNGLVRSLAVLGPFQDTGGGLMRREGPEAPGQSFSDAAARYSWGIYEVMWRRVLPSSASPRGVPLDLYVHPRSESCTYLASRVSFPAGARPAVVHLAASGAVRLLWDGADVAASEDTHPHLSLDRLAARVEAPAGDHLLAVKVCSAAVADDGRVRLRFTDEQGKPLAVASSSDLRPLHLAPAPAAAPALVPAVAPEPAGRGGRASRASKAPAAEKPAVAARGGGKGGGAKGGGAKGAGARSGAKANVAPEAEAAATPAAARVMPPPGVTLVRTPLEKGLDVGTSPSVAQALEAGILRILGGGEDQRSPRAPGLLDRVVRAADLPADTLAMAGWISPFGANRSAWLNQARERALAQKDEGAAAFAQRRLVASHLSAHLTEWAISTMKEEPLASATDPEARLIKALPKRGLGGTGLTRATTDELLGLEAEQKDRTAVSVLQEILGSPYLPRDVILRLARHLGEVRPDARDATYVRNFRLVDGAALEVAAASALAQLTSADDLLRVGRELLDTGRYAWAREVFYTATQLAPNRSGGFQGLATVRQAIAGAEARAGKPPSEDPRLALAALARARDLDPSDTFLKAEIALRTGASSPSAAGHQAGRDERFLVPPDVFLGYGRQNPAKKGEVVDRQLSWVRVVTYHPDKRVSQLMHYAREIVIEPRTDADLVESQVPAEGDETELLLARVHRKDGTIAMPEEQQSGARQPFIRWPALKAGDVVEVAVRSWTAGPVGRRGDAPFYFIDYVGAPDTHPILYNEVVVDSPDSSPLAIDVLNGKAERIEKTAEGGRTVTRYIWSHPPSIADEPLAPKLSESLPVVVGSTFASWNDFREWYRGAVAGFTEPDEQVRRVAAELTKGKTSREDKLKAIFEFVADDIRYVNYVSGEWWLPNRPQELLNRNQGDCDDKAMLLITLLKAVGIDATEVLVQTRYTAQPSLLRSEKVAIPMFDHGIAFLPGKGKGDPGTWLDATSPESRLGPLPSMDARAVALFVDQGPAKIQDTPASSAAEHGTDAKWKIQLSPSGAGDLVAEERETGDTAFELRMNLKQADGRSTWVEQNLAAGWFPTVQVKPEVDFKTDLPRGATALRYEAHSDGLAQREGGELAVPIAEAATLTSQLAPIVKRTLPVVLPPRLAPGHQTHEITIVAPAGFTFADLPPGGEEAGGEFGTARVEFKRVSATTVVVKTSVVFDLSTIPVDKYERWRGWLQRSDGLMHRMVRLVPDGRKALPATASLAGDCLESDPCSNAVANGEQPRRARAPGPPVSKPSRKPAGPR